MTVKATLLASLLLLVLAGSAHAAFPGEDGKLALNGDPAGNGQSGIYLAEPDGSVISLLKPAPRRDGIALSISDDEPQFSPDGARVTFIRNFSSRSGLEPPDKVWVIDADGTDLTRIGSGFRSTFAPNGEVVFESEEGIFAANPDGTNVRRIDQARWGVLSPVADELAFAETRPVMQNEIFLANRDGTGETRVTRAPNDVRHTVTDFSPDGARLAFSRHDTGPGPLGGIWTIGRDGTDETQLTGAQLHSSPQFSPAGDRIAFHRDVGNRGEPSRILVMNADGTGSSLVTTGARLEDWGPAPQPASTGGCRGLEATVLGTGLDDTITGTSGRDVIQAGDGDDTVQGGGGGDLVCGGAGDDTLRGGMGPDELFGDAGLDTCAGDRGADTVRCERGS